VDLGLSARTGLHPKNGKSRLVSVSIYTAPMNRRRTKCLFSVLTLVLLVGCGWIDDDDSDGRRSGRRPAVTIAATDESATEGTPVTDVGSLTVSRTGSTKEALEVSLAIGGTASNAAGADFAEAPLGTTLVIPAGAASTDIQITPIDDSEVEGIETIEVSLTDGDEYRLGNVASATVLLTDDDAIILDVSVEEANQLIEDHQADPDFVILDVRTPEEYETGHLENAENLNFNDSLFPVWIDALDRKATYLIYCRTGSRSTGARNMMESFGFARVYNMMTGIVGWTNAGYPIVTD
jgi:rhodanese-related sulfurtransferase